MPENLRPTHSDKTLRAVIVDRAVRRITFARSEAKLEKTLYIFLPKLNEQEVLFPGSLAPRLNIDLSVGHPSNFLVQNVSQALVDRQVVKFAGTILQDTVGYDIHKTFEDQVFRSEVTLAKGTTRLNIKVNP